MTRRRFSARALMARLLEYQGRCAHCDCKVGGSNGLEWDHIIPLELGGEDDLTNLQPLCKACHKAKTATDIRAIRKAERMRQREAGVRRQSRNPLPFGSGHKLKKKVSGEVVERTN